MSDIPKPVWNVPGGHCKETPLEQKKPGWHGFEQFGPYHPLKHSQKNPFFEHRPFPEQVIDELHL
jgi:hypothetical protein